MYHYNIIWCIALFIVGLCLVDTRYIVWVSMLTVHLFIFQESFSLKRLRHWIHMYMYTIHRCGRHHAQAYLWYTMGILCICTSIYVCICKCILHQYMYKYTYIFCICICICICTSICICICICTTICICIKACWQFKCLPVTDIYHEILWCYQLVMHEGIIALSLG